MYDELEGSELWVPSEAREKRERLYEAGLVGVLGLTPFVGELVTFASTIASYADIVEKEDPIKRQTGNGSSSFDSNEHDRVVGGNKDFTFAAVETVPFSIEAEESQTLAVQALWREDGRNKLDHGFTIHPDPATPGVAAPTAAIDISPEEPTAGE